MSEFVHLWSYAEFEGKFVHAMARREFSLIILDQDPNWIWGNPEAYYAVNDQPAISDPGAFWPVTGWETRPRLETVPRGN